MIAKLTFVGDDVGPVDGDEEGLAEGGEVGLAEGEPVGFFVMARL